MMEEKTKVIYEPEVGEACSEMCLLDMTQHELSGAVATFTGQHKTD